MPSENDVERYANGHKRSSSKDSSMRSKVFGTGRVPINLTFQKINYSVVGKNNKTITIIKGVSGKCSAGRLTAMMGHSGAGKTSLLDILACNTKGGLIEGTVLVNNNLRDPVEYRRNTCYILQRDILLSTATVREALTTSAYLRLPQKMPNSIKRERVEKLLEELELTRCANTLIGDADKGIKGISGGERRRVSVGIGLVTGPMVIFLDEPTSGLDSETAVGLVKILKRLAKKNCTVVCTIHQPNSDITENFDDLILLADGHIVYAGEWKNSVPYFRDRGFSCPNFKNPSDYFMSITKSHETVEKLTEYWAKEEMDKLLTDAEEGRRGVPSRVASEEVSGSYPNPGDSRTASASPLMVVHPGGGRVTPTPPSESGPEGASSSSDISLRPRLTSDGMEMVPLTGMGAGKDAFNSVEASDGTTGIATPGRMGISGRIKQVTSKIGESVSPRRVSSRSLERNSRTLEKTDSLDHYMGEEYKVSSVHAAWWQVWVLSVRFSRTWWRDPILISDFLFQYCFAGIFIGLIYLQLDSKHVDAAGIFDRNAALFLILAVLAFTPTETACTLWDSERLLLRRESESGQYSIGAFFIAKSLTSIPFQMFVTTLFVFITYFMIHFQYRVRKFLVYLVVCNVFQLIAETLGLMCAIGTKTSTTAIIVASCVLLVLLSFNGFLVLTIPSYFKWISSISFLSFAYTALVHNERHGLGIDPKQAVCSIPDGHGGMRPIGPTDNGLSTHSNVLVLFCLLIGMRIVAFLELLLVARLRRL